MADILLNPHTSASLNCDPGWLSPWGGLNVKKIWLSALILPVLFLSLVVQASAIPLSTLISGGGSITQGDKIFSNFSATLNNSGTTPGAATTPADLSGIDVNGIFLGGLNGLAFSGNINAIAPPGTTASLDILLSYTVTVAPGSGALISDIHLLFNGTCRAQTTASPTGICDVNTTESVVDGTEIIGSAQVDALNQSDTADLTRLVTSATVVKDISLTAIDNAVANISFIDQLVSQTVPEPGTILLLGIGLGAVGVWSRKRQK